MHSAAIALPDRVFIPVCIVPGVYVRVEERSPGNGSHCEGRGAAVGARPAVVADTVVEWKGTAARTTTNNMPVPAARAGG